MDECAQGINETDGITLDKCTSKQYRREYNNEEHCLHRKNTIPTQMLG